MSDPRPVFLNLTQIRLPVTAIASILHRITGVVLLLSLPFWLWALQATLGTAESFQQLQTCLQSVLGKLVVWGGLSALFYHLFAGIRHIIMDMGLAESLCAARASAKAVIVLAVIASALMGVWIW